MLIPPVLQGPLRQTFDLLVLSDATLSRTQASGLLLRPRPPPTTVAGSSSRLQVTGSHPLLPTGARSSLFYTKRRRKHKTTEGYLTDYG